MERLKKRIKVLTGRSETGLKEAKVELRGKMIKKIFENAELIAKLHGTLTSPKGDHFRRRLLHMLSSETEITKLEELAEKNGLRELNRHINKLLKFKLVKPIQIEGKNGYVRTELGERAINALRALEKKIGRRHATKIYDKAFLGSNSIRLFLKVYGCRKETDFKEKEIKYTPLEVGKLSLFLPRTIEGISAIEKLDIAGLLVFGVDEHVHLTPNSARSFYQYLQELYKIAVSPE